MTKAVLISGSPRIAGNTEHLLQRCGEVLKGHGIEVELIQLAGKEIRGCSACGVCRIKQSGRCECYQDDFNDLLERIKVAEIIVVGSPVYFGSATPEIMALLDRAGYVSRSCGNFLSRKVGGPLAVGRRGGHNFTYAQMLMWFMINDIIVPGSTYWNIGFGKDKGEVEEDAEALATIDRFAENLSWLTKKIDGK